jgi:hypothetical protein
LVDQRGITLGVFDLAQAVGYVKDSVGFFAASFDAN